MYATIIMAPTAMSSRPMQRRVPSLNSEASLAALATRPGLLRSVGRRWMLEQSQAMLELREPKLELLELAPRDEAEIACEAGDRRLRRLPHPRRVLSEALDDGFHGASHYLALPCGRVRRR